jgi:hypothetical protein
MSTNNLNATNHTAPGVQESLFDIPVACDTNNNTSNNTALDEIAFDEAVALANGA